MFNKTLFNKGRYNVGNVNFIAITVSSHVKDITTYLIKSVKTSKSVEVYINNITSNLEYDYSFVFDVVSSISNINTLTDRYGEANKSLIISISPLEQSTEVSLRTLIDVLRFVEKINTDASYRRLFSTLFTVSPITTVAGWGSRLEIKIKILERYVNINSD